MSNPPTVGGWAIGQRVRNEAEPSLGLGTIEGFPTTRSVQVFFPAAGERRMYNPVSAPLRRYELGVGQSARTRDGRAFRVERVEEDAQGLLTYHGGGLAVHEAELEDASASNDPLQRLIAGEFGHHDAFDLRELAWRLRSEVMRQRTRGLMGARVSLLPHQLAIAAKVAAREYPRVLLADEVGLGKTIEACLIYAALRALGRADRVLVLTPPSLVHQWLVELYRRFNELFSVVQAEVPENPFADAPRLIAPLDWLLEPERLSQALEQPWDLVIVDEAHHLIWSPEGASPRYRAVEALAKQSQGLLLLTATPLRQGLDTEFGLLRLVDPERFTDFGLFRQEHAHMREVAELARRLAEGQDVAKELREHYPEAKWDGAPEASLQQLIDRHGTGRVLVRNRRDKLGGFPGRQLHLDVLPLPEAWQKAKAWPEIGWLRAHLGKPAPTGHEPTPSHDPRWAWVLEKIQGLGGQKVVVMAASVEAVKLIERHLRTRGGINAALFHEELGLIERDRQAAYFADPDGAQVLISSEIGSEGRNFQFCHHLILFDLPLHPDALEQRIGRLDRIGQTTTIQVHVGVVDRTPGQALFEWHRRLQVFEAPLTGGEHMLEAQASRLLEALEAHTPARLQPLDAFLAETEEVMALHRAEVQASVDFLVDLNSFDQPLGSALVHEVEGFDHALLHRCVSDLLEHFGVVEEDFADHRIRRIRPGNHMKVEPFPGLRADGYLGTYDRDLALAREDMQFLSPDHPLVEGALALLLDLADGRASAALWQGAPERGVWVEFLFVLEVVGPDRLGLPRFLPPTSLKLVVGTDGREREVPAGMRLQPLSPSIWAQLAGLLHDALPEVLEDAAAVANERLQSQVAEAVARAREVLGGEQRRLEELRGLGNVPAVELASHAAKVDETLRCLAGGRVSLDAIRVLLLDP